MLSSRLVRMIEEHWDPLTHRIIKEIRSDRRLRHFGGLPEGELRDRGQDILEHLGDWLTLLNETELAHHFEKIGAERYREGVPLQEVVLLYVIIKNQTIEFARGEGIGNSAMEVYAEEELELDLGRFFDRAVYRVVRGYEEAAWHVAHNNKHAHVAGAHA